MSELRKRILSSLLLLIIVSAIFGVFAFAPTEFHVGIMSAILMLIVARLGFEWSYLIPINGQSLHHPILRYASSFGAVLLFAALLMLFFQQLYAIMFAVVAGLLLLTFGHIIISFLHRDRHLVQDKDISPMLYHQRSMAILGAVYSALAATGFFAFWYSADGFKIVTWIVLVVIIADSGAYFGGKRWGKRKLCPSISPGKTWAGLFSALFAVLLVYGLGAVFFAEFSLPLNLIYLMLIALVVLLSVWGDLYISLLKRRSGLKDVTVLLPGHGGLLDRFDGQLMVFSVFSPLAFWLL